MISYLPTTLLLSTLSCITASTSTATTVSILEFGPKGSVRPTTASSPLTSVGGVTSFWNAVHDLPSSRSASAGSLTTQYPGMTVVPDLFQRPKGGIVLGIVGSGVNVEEMPTLAALVEQQEEESAVVGQFHLKGAQGKTLLRQVSTTKVQDGDELESMTLAKVQSISSSPSAKHSNTLSSVVAHVDGEMTPTQMDTHLKRTLEAISQHAQETSSSIIVHLIVEEDASQVAHRRLLSTSSHSSSSSSRMMMEDDDEEQDNENENGGGNGGNVAGMYAYFDEDTNEMVYPYKTMFQIQYYNIVLWTSIGLFAILATANLMTMNMPLMADTLLFGESAKMVAE